MFLNMRTNNHNDNNHDYFYISWKILTIWGEEMTGH